ncbi:MAG: pyruvate ferredoxin oxidoreductase [Proteobacteria bacterium]|nr:pyruvate ferredoxin oxidoreductase [Pseudomonadota bacterium]
MKRVISGNKAVAYGVMLSQVKVISAYPITPQTTIVEELSRFCAEGDMQAKFIKVESEHSAIASIIASCLAGSRSFTATSSQGLTLMHEMLHWAAGGRLPLVMVNVNRALGPGWNIWTEQSDSLSQRDTGWIQLYCEDNQEVLDTIIQAFKIAETVCLPVMVVLDAFFLSHTSEIVEIPHRAEVDQFLPPFEPKYPLNTRDPQAYYGMCSPDYYMEFRYKMQRAMEETVEVAKGVDEEFGRQFGRTYGVVEPYRCEDAKVVMVTSGTVTSTARVVVDRLWEDGIKVGLLKVKMFRPFPMEEIKGALKGVEKVGVIDRNISFGHGGIFAQEVRSTFCNENGRPTVFGFIMGLGGRDVTPEAIEEAIRVTLENARPKEEILWIHLKE